MGDKRNWASYGHAYKDKKKDDGLLPCPWCGKVPIVRRYALFKTGEIRYGVWCNNGNGEECPLIALETLPFERREDAIAAWNKRADTKQEKEMS